MVFFNPYSRLDAQIVAAHKTRGNMGDWDKLF